MEVDGNKVVMVRVKTLCTIALVVLLLSALGNLQGNQMVEAVINTLNLGRI